MRALYHDKQLSFLGTGYLTLGVGVYFVENKGMIRLYPGPWSDELF